MAFDEAHRSFIQYHVDNRKGERRGRLERGHGHAEELFLRNVWWPLRGDFQHLHPEYEVTDWRGRSYFADFAWQPGMLKLIFEIKGFASHIRDMDRQKFCNELNREQISVRTVADFPCTAGRERNNTTCGAASSSDSAEGCGTAS